MDEGEADNLRPVEAELQEPDETPAADQEPTDDSQGLTSDFAVENPENNQNQPSLELQRIRELNQEIQALKSEQRENPPFARLEEIIKRLEAIEIELSEPDRTNAEPASVLVESTDIRRAPENFPGTVELPVEIQPASSETVDEPVPATPQESNLAKALRRIGVEWGRYVQMNDKERGEAIQRLVDGIPDDKPETEGETQPKPEPISLSDTEKEFIEHILSRSHQTWADPEKHERLIRFFQGMGRFWSKLKTYGVAAVLGSKKAETFRRKAGATGVAISSASAVFGIGALLSAASKWTVPIAEKFPVVGHFVRGVSGLVLGQRLSYSLSDRETNETLRSSSVKTSFLSDLRQTHLSEDEDRPFGRLDPLGRFLARWNKTKVARQITVEEIANPEISDERVEQIAAVLQYRQDRQLLMGKEPELAEMDLLIAALVRLAESHTDDLVEMPETENQDFSAAADNWGSQHLYDKGQREPNLDERLSVAYGTARSDHRQRMGKSIAVGVGTGLGFAFLMPSIVHGIRDGYEALKTRLGFGHQEVAPVVAGGVASTAPGAAGNREVISTMDTHQITEQLHATTRDILHLSSDPSHPTESMTSGLGVDQDYVGHLGRAAGFAEPLGIGHLDDHGHFVWGHGFEHDYERSIALDHMGVKIVNGRLDFSGLKPEFHDQLRTAFDHLRQPEVTSQLQELHLRHEVVESMAHRAGVPSNDIRTAWADPRNTELRQMLGEQFNLAQRVLHGEIKPSDLAVSYHLDSAALSGNPVEVARRVLTAAFKQQEQSLVLGGNLDTATAWKRALGLAVEKAPAAPVQPTGQLSGAAAPEAARQAVADNRIFTERLWSKPGLSGSTPNPDAPQPVKLFTEELWGREPADPVPTAPVDGNHPGEQYTQIARANTTPNGQPGHVEPQLDHIEVVKKAFKGASPTTAKPGAPLESELYRHTTVVGEKATAASSGEASLSEGVNGHGGSVGRTPVDISSGESTAFAGQADIDWSKNLESVPSR